MGEVKSSCQVLARLSLDVRAQEVSGARLIEWAKLCGASGIVIPGFVEPSVTLLLGQQAEAAGLQWHPETNAPAGYSDKRTDYVHALRAALLGAPVVTKGLTLNRSLGGQEHEGSLEPDELAELVYFLREPAPDQAPAAPSLWHTASFVAAKPLASGHVIKRQDVKLVPELCGVTAELEAGVIGSRVRDARQPGEPITFGILEPWTTDPAHQEVSQDITVVIRAKNEGAWLVRSLPAMLHQQRPPKEIILIDNESADNTAEVAVRFGCRISRIPDAEFKFGRALNRGIEMATTPWVLSVSAHCIPVHDRWLDAFRERLDDPFVAGVYGRQEPLPTSTDFDKRDLWTTFGEERRRQRGRDYFFHNANSLIRCDVWERHQFNDKINGVEDRDWARRVLADGYVIEYAPLASVHHYHGIHQGRNEDRAKRVVKVIELIQQREPAEAKTR